ncbi:hypothetical protein [Poritiphilus flavus]|uniref:Uncharacterized protein n=1 Tax=Poritiphilus flavus TaxID=2697053 RepID=A0A6L9EH37_9FLAO|nr:hypothetical protein [Poritiphilus flavus]NAS14011.1 hypothetical protein [Poritiphilus flavus]
MRKYLASLTFLFVTILVLAMAYPIAESEYTPVPEEQEEAPLTDSEAFDQMMAVLTHKRCVNCHPSDNSPKQGEDSHPHRFGVLRGTDNHGMPAVRCNTCHQAENNSFSGVPGAPEWSLAPMSMQWEGLSRTEIAKSMLDRARNGNRSHEDIMHHLTEHELVLWAWEPGVDAEGRPREKPPVPKEAYITAVKAWFDSGAIIPEE